MSHPGRIFIKLTPGTPAPGVRIPFPEDQKDHFFKVLRLRPGAKLTAVLNDVGCVCETVITPEGDLVIESVIEASSEISAPVRSLAFALCKGKKNEFVIEKAVELGVSTLILWQSDHSVVKPADPKSLKNKMTRWQKIAEQAAAQSRKNLLPSVTYVSKAAEAIAEITRLHRPEELLIMCSIENGAKELKSLGLKRHPVHLLIGPEGDFSAREITLFKEAGFLPASLGPWVLRSETAAIAAIAQVQALS